MEFDNISELAKEISVDIMRETFIAKKKFPINKEVTLDIHKLPDSDAGDMAKEDPEEFTRLVNGWLTTKLNYLYSEGFLAKKKGFYRVYTEKELQMQLDNIVANGMD
jgi:hypothetical protein